MQIEDTVRAIRQAEAERYRRTEEKRRRALPVARLDAIIEELERMHLRGGIKVSAVMIRRIEEFLADVPDDCRHEFPLRTTITRVMDNLYLVQDCLLSRKDYRREAIRSLDDDERNDFSAA
ncbi:MAG: hypothetical protein QOK05_1618 [Chloroflexota bacterium]|nr:hypothetical protein [Chloroflexota bacterium]